MSVGRQSSTPRLTGRITFGTAGLVGIPLLSVALATGFAGAAEPESDKFFDSQIKPILAAHCFACHGGGGKPQGGLDLTSRAGVMKGGAGGPSLDLKKPERSPLLRAINFDGRQMPPRGKLPRAQIDLLTRWVRMGAPWPAAKAAAPHPHAAPQVNDETKRFWSFQPVRRPQVPVVKSTRWVTNDIDRFILARLEAAGLTPAAPADRVALIRRATYDLTGLPPTPEHVREFLADRTPHAFEKVIDRLLGSPQYGERWARHWLDIVRYAETNSFERDDPKPYVWRYRDYVIQSFNDDKPYDQFLREQLAGDELPFSAERLIATGFYRLGAWDDEPADPQQAFYDDMDDILTTVGQGILGLTVNCARCHDHKIDPIPQRDYYRLLAFFRGVRRFGVRSPESVAAASLRSIATPEDEQRYAREIEDHRARIRGLDERISRIEDLVRVDFAPVEHEEFKAEQARFPIVQKRVGKVITEAQFDDYRRALFEKRRLLRNPPRQVAQALCVTEGGSSPRPTHVLGRGNPQSPAEEVGPGFPAVLSFPDPSIPDPGPGATISGRRTVLAQWVTDARNPLTARVWVNRVWQWHFGRGIVRSPNNFGFQGTPPTHPELLDWLADDLLRNGWKLKRLHRLIMLSSAYRMGSAPDTRALEKDPENDLFWRFNPRRLEAEEIRDSILQVNGSLNPKMFGPSIYPAIPAEVLAGQSRPGYGWPTSSPEDQARRSVYVHGKRSLPLPILAGFDAPDTDSTCPVRFSTTQPTQALSLLNSAFLNEQAAVLRNRAMKEGAGNIAAAVERVLEVVTQRKPTQREIQRGAAFVAELKRREGTGEEEGMRLFSLLALNLNEFLFLD